MNITGHFKSSNGLYCCLGLALFAITGCMAQSSETEATNENCATSPASANELLLNIFPNAAIVSADPLDLGAGIKAAGCLLEVNMLVDKEDLATKGFVYVLPDGKNFINGPILNKRTVFTAAKQGNQSRSDSQLETFLDQNKQVMAMFTERMKEFESKLVDSSNPTGSTSPVTLTAPESQASKSAVQSETQANDSRQAIFDQLKNLPAIRSNEIEGGKDVYVMVDPLCINCARLSQQSEQVAGDNKIRWHWLPMFTSEKGWVISALALKLAETDEAAAADLLHSAMQPDWNPNEYKDLVGSLTEADYGKAKANLVVFHSMLQRNPKLGTPLVLFERADGEIELISGVPTADDWITLH